MSFLSKITSLFSKKPKNLFEEEIEANRISSKQNGWSPGWFGCADFDDKLINQVKRFQKQYFIEENGIVGPLTFRRLITERESLGYTPFKQVSFKGSGFNPTIIKSGKRLAINWDKVINFEDNPSWAASAKSYRPWTAGQRKNELFVVHWDAALSSRSCLNILAKRNLSVHFLIDNDGTIIQTMDLDHEAYHAGSRPINQRSIGVEISNAFYTKYQKTYVSNKFGQRPLLKGTKVHGGIIQEHLGFYPVQIEALKALIKFLNGNLGIPLETPSINGKEVNTIYQPILDGKFKGIVHHYQISTEKIDCAGLDLVALLKSL